METLEYIVGEHGEKKAVVLSIEEYEELMEDLHDLRIVAERKNEGEMDLVELKERLKKDGILD